MKIRMDTYQDKLEATSFFNQILASCEITNEQSDYLRELIKNALKNNNNSSAATSGDYIDPRIRDFFTDYDIKDLSDDFQYDDRDYTEVSMVIQPVDKPAFRLVVTVSEFQDIVTAIYIGADDKVICDRWRAFFLPSRCYTKDRNKADHDACFDIEI